MALVSHLFAFVPTKLLFAYAYIYAVKCNLTKLTTKSAVSVLVSMVSDFWHTGMRMAIVGQRLLVFEHAQTTGTHCSEILLAWVLIIGKFVFFLKFSIIPLPPSPLTQSV
jgi:hypothetical protein